MTGIPRKSENDGGISFFYTCTSRELMIAFSERISKRSELMGKDSAELTENGKKTRDLIFQTAVKILKEEGYDKVTVRRICKESNTSNGSFYHFFKNKDELLAYYYTRSADEFMEGQEETMKNADLYHQMLLCYRWYIRYTSEFGLDFCMNFFNSNNRSVDPLYMYNAFYEISKKYLHEKSDEIREGYNADDIAKELCILAKGIIFDWSTSRGAYDIEAVAERMFSIYLNGVIKKTGEEA